MKQPIQKIIHTLAQAAKNSAHILANTSTEQKNNALKAIAAAIYNQQVVIQQANQKDLKAAQEHNEAFLDRLLLNEQRISAMTQSLEDIAQLPDPVGVELAQWQRPNGLNISRVSVPLGVIAVIYESRPNVTADAAGLCLKAGNAVILRGGKESFYSASAIMTCIQQGLTTAKLSTDCIQMVPTTDRTAIAELLTMDDYIDVIIPRGGKALIQYLSQESRIPLFKHLEGICHTYIHQDANAKMATSIVYNAKMRRTGICGATETLLIDDSIAASYLPAIIEQLIAANCEIRGDKQVLAIDQRVQPAHTDDWASEYLAPIIAIKTVADINEAIAHINQHGSQHTDAIITDNNIAAEQFLNEIESAIVMHNTSTQFADGAEFGMGAEIGISTGKLHARGPVGVEQLTTFKYKVRGTGQVR